MLPTRLSRRYLWGVVSVCLAAGVVMWGCTLPAPPPAPPSPPPVDVSRRLAALEECIVRSQMAVSTATRAGISAGALAPSNSSIADAQDAVDEGKSLEQQGKQQAAADRLAKALEECEKIDGMVLKVHQDAAERKVRVQMMTEAETRLSWTVLCVDGARQAARRASAVGVREAELTGARAALESAETTLKQAHDSLAQNDPKGAIGHLEAAQADCQRARDASDRAAAKKMQPAASPARPRRSR